MQLLLLLLQATACKEISDAAGAVSPAGKAREDQEGRTCCCLKRLLGLGLSPLDRPVNMPQCTAPRVAAFSMQGMAVALSCPEVPVAAAAAGLAGWMTERNLRATCCAVSAEAI
jgi:hypothetical protein